MDHEQHIVEPRAIAGAHRELAARVCADREELKQFMVGDTAGPHSGRRCSQRVLEDLAALRANRRLASHVDDVEVPGLRHFQVDEPAAGCEVDVVDRAHDVIAGAEELYREWRGQSLPFQCDPVTAWAIAERLR